MAMVSTFEILSLKGGRWEVMAVVKSKNEAISQAEHHLKKGFFSAIEVIEERYDEETGKSTSLVIFNKVKVLHRTKEQYTGKERRKGKEWRQNPKKHGREHKKKSRSEKKRRNATLAQQMVRGAIILLVVLGLSVVGLVYLVDSLLV